MFTASCLDLPCLAFPFLALHCFALPCLVLSVLVFSCLVLPCLFLSCFAWSCLVFCCLVLRFVALPRLVSLVSPCLALPINHRKNNQKSFKKQSTNHANIINLGWFWSLVRPSWACPGSVLGYGVEKGVGELSFLSGLLVDFGSLGRPLGHLWDPLGCLWVSFGIHFHEKSVKNAFQEGFRKMNEKNMKKLSKHEWFWEGK